MDPRHTQFQDFSVIIPTYKRPRQLAECIAALQVQTYPAEKFEIIIVHDGEDPQEAPAQYRTEDDHTINLFQIPKQGVSAARNAGAREARGRWLAFTDDDCVPEPNWLEKLGDHLSVERNTAVGGATINGLSGNHFAAASAILETYIYQIQYQSAKQSTQQPYFAAKNVALPRRQFLQIGGFDQSMQTAEDRNFCDRWLDCGYKLRYAPEARIAHHHNLNARSFLKQHYHYGIGNYHYHHHRQKQGAERNRIEALRWYAGLAAAPWQNHRVFNASLLTMLLLFSQAANVGGYLTAWLGPTKPGK